MRWWVLGKSWPELLEAWFELEPVLTTIEMYRFQYFLINGYANHASSKQPLKEQLKDSEFLPGMLKAFQSFL